MQEIFERAEGPGWNTKPGGTAPASARAPPSTPSVHSLPSQSPVSCCFGLKAQGMTAMPLLLPSFSLGTLAQAGRHTRFAPCTHSLINNNIPL